MVKYVVKETSVATPENPNFAGETSIMCYGKDGVVLYRGGTHCRHPDEHMWMWGVTEYGYNRLCDAKRNWVYKNPENSEYWTSTVEIVEVEC